MAEENYMNQGPDVSPQVGTTGEQNTGNELDPVWLADNTTLKAVECSNESRNQHGPHV